MEPDPETTTTLSWYPTEYDGYAIYVYSRKNDRYVELPAATQYGLYFMVTTTRKRHPHDVLQEFIFGVPADNPLVKKIVENDMQWFDLEPAMRDTLSEDLILLN